MQSEFALIFAPSLTDALSSFTRQKTHSTVAERGGRKRHLLDGGNWRETIVQERAFVDGATVRAFCQRVQRLGRVPSTGDTAARYLFDRHAARWPQAQVEKVHSY